MWTLIDSVVVTYVARVPSGLLFRTIHPNGGVALAFVPTTEDGAERYLKKATADEARRR